MVLNDFRSQVIEWDKATGKIYESITASEGDSNGRKLIVHVLNEREEEDLTGSVLSLAWHLKENQGLDAFVPIDATKGIFEIYYTTGMLSNIGTLTASLVLVTPDGRIESEPFNIVVKQSVVDDTAVQSQNSFTLLTQALVELAEWGSRIDAVEQDFKDRAEALETTYAPRLTGVEIKLPQVSVTDFGAVPDSNQDQTPYIKAGIDHLVSIGGGTLFFPVGTFKIDGSNATTAPYNPKRVEIRGYITGEETETSDTRVVNFVENIHIKGADGSIIYMTGMSEDYLYNQDDIQMSNVDIFTAFSFAYAKNCSVSNLTFKGDYLVEGRPFRYSEGVSQARAKAIGFFGSHNCEVHDCKFEGILGNFVHVNTASRLLDGYWMPSSNINVYNNKGNLCLEIGINLTTLTNGCKIYNNTLSHANGAAIEGPGAILNNTIFDCKGGGISPSYDAIVTNNTIANVRDAFVLAITSDKSNAQRLSSLIFGNIVKNIRRHVLNVYPGSGNTVFKDNQISNPNLENTEGAVIFPMIFLNGTSTKKVKNLVISGNKIEVSNANVKANYGIFAQYVSDSKIDNNVFDVMSEIVLLSDIYRTNTSNVSISKNILSKGLGAGSNNKERNIVSENVFPNNRMPITSDWYGLTPPDEGDWQIGDFLKKQTSTTTNLDGSYNLSIGWRCVSVNPLIWKEEKTRTVGDRQTKGNATIPTSATSVVVTHGLNSTPTHINVTPRGRIGFFWVTDVTAATFKLNCSETSSFDQLVWWSVNV